MIPNLQTEVKNMVFARSGSLNLQHNDIFWPVTVVFILHFALLSLKKTAVNAQSKFGSKTKVLYNLVSLISAQN